MIDAEVMRLRRLRNTALRARAIARALDSHPERRGSLFSRSAVGFWQVARMITGKLRENPYLSYQRGPSEMRAVYDRISAGLLASAAVSRGRRGRIFLAELERAARELDDARALTWSPDLSDSLGRSQAQVRALIKEAAAAVRKEGGSHVDRDVRMDARMDVRDAALADDAGAVAGSWPYLAF
jgi:hypothetical protein